MANTVSIRWSVNVRPVQILTARENSSEWNGNVWSCIDFGKWNGIRGGGKPKSQPIPFEIGWSANVYILIAMLKSSKLFKNWQKSRNSLNDTPFSCLTRSSKRSKYMSYSSVSLKEEEEESRIDWRLFSQCSSLEWVEHSPNMCIWAKSLRNPLLWWRYSPSRTHRTPIPAPRFEGCPWTCKIPHNANPDCLFCQRNALAMWYRLCDVAAIPPRPHRSCPGIQKSVLMLVVKFLRIIWLETYIIHWDPMFVSPRTDEYLLHLLKRNTRNELVAKIYEIFEQYRSKHFQTDRYLFFVFFFSSPLVPPHTNITMYTISLFLQKGLNSHRKNKTNQQTKK